MHQLVAQEPKWRKLYFEDPLHKAFEDAKNLRLETIIVNRPKSLLSENTKPILRIEY